MYDWVRALLDPAEIVQSPSSVKKLITPPPKFEMPAEEETAPPRGRSRRSVSPSKVSPSKKSSSPRKSRARATQEVPNTPSTTAANDSLQKALDVTVEAVENKVNGALEFVSEEMGIKTGGSPEKKRGRKPKKALAEVEEEKETVSQEKDEKEKKAEKKEQKEEKKKAEKEEKNEEKKAEKKSEKKKNETAEPEVVIDNISSEEIPEASTSISLDMPLLPEVPSAKETEEMIAKAKEMVEDAIKTQTAEGATEESSITVTKKRKPEEDDDEETSAEAAQRAKKAKVLEDKLKRERVRNRALFGVSAAFALAYVSYSLLQRGIR